jgi:HSP20 family molecular chaperone IbpA
MKKTAQEDQTYWDNEGRYKEYDLYDSPYPGTAVGHGKVERNPLFSESLNHSGKGPNNWSKSDVNLQEEVSVILAMSPQVDATDIEVKVEQGIVYLNGSVPDRKMKREAERCLDGVKGIKDIHNRLLLGTAGPAQRTPSIH